MKRARAMVYSYTDIKDRLLNVLVFGRLKNPLINKYQEISLH
jgi:hypothetical protein